MKRPRPRLHTLLALVLLTGALLTGGTHADGCGTPAFTVLEFEVSEQAVSTTVTNSESSPQAGFVVNEVLFRGNIWPIGVPLTIDPGDVYDVELTFNEHFELLSGYTCDDGSGIVEAPDPVTVNVNKRNKDHDEVGQVRVLPRRSRPAR